MFPRPPPILQQSLHAIVDHPQNYFADVCFRYDTGQVWAHKAILKTRAPQDFQLKYLGHAIQGIQHIDISEEELPLAMLQRILRFWYTASFVPWSESDTPSIELSALSLSDSKISSTSTVASDESHSTRNQPPAATIDSTETSTFRAEVQELENKLDIKLLPTLQDNANDDYQQWINDISRMRADQITTDIVVRISCLSDSIPDVPALTVPNDNPTSFSVHRFMLAAQSPYFNALFNSQFKDSDSSTVNVPPELFTSASLDCILQYYYSSTLVIPKAPTRKTASAASERLTQKKFALRLMQKVFRGADYLGQTSTICALALYEIAQICHQFKCTCADCQLLLPSVLSFSDKVVTTVPQLRPTVLRLYTDPIQGIAKLWPQKPFALLVNSLGIVSEDTGSNSFLVRSEGTPSALIGDINSQTIQRITKSNAIQTFHAMHLCLSQLRASDPIPTWSEATLNLINPVIHHNALLVAMNFDYFCVEYPILLSCVDGIGFGFSYDFLEFLLNRVLDEGMQDVNAGTLYQGIVRDLIGRQEVVKNIAVGDILEAARAKCVAYLRRRWVGVKAQNGFKDLDKETLRTMAEDIGVPHRTLSKPMDSDFMKMFSFKPYSKSSKVAADVDATKAKGSSIRSSSANPGRLSLSGIRRSRSNSNTNRPTSPPPSAATDSPREESKGRSNSAGDVAVSAVPAVAPSSVSRSPSSDTTSKTKTPEAQPLMIPQKPREPQGILDLMSMETESRQRRQARHAPPTSEGSFSSLTDVLLPIESTSSDAGGDDAATAPRQSRLKFALPETPARTRSPNRSRSSTRSHSPNRQPAALRYSKPRKSSRTRWSLSGGSDTSDDDESTYLPITIGARVELLRRPLPTQGYVRYLGKLAGQEGTWVGVELDSRVGKNDGSVDGQRYFQTDSQRGIFVREDDLVVLGSPPVSQ